ncbi:16289_t:CDS:2, partial [Dentiscutata heterogama]
EASKALSDMFNQQTTHLVINYSKIPNFSVNSDNKDDSNDDTCPKDDRTSGLSKTDEIVNNAPKISTIQPYINLNNGVIQIPTKLIDESWSFFMTYFLNTGLLWIFQARDVAGYER